MNWHHILRLFPARRESSPETQLRYRIAGACVLCFGLMFLAEQANGRESTPVEESPRRPNVLFIAIDDLAPSLAGDGRTVLQTPHLDALARSGVRFDRAYCQIPLCNPSRASVMTGMRPDELRVYDLDRHFRDEVPDVVTLPQLFRQQGWRVARVGKIYHYNVPAGIGTDGLDDPVSWDQTINPKGRDVAEEALIINPTPARPISAALSWLAAEGTDEEQTDGLVASRAIDWLTEQQQRPRNGEHTPQPFFLGVGFFRPHTPFVAPRSYFEQNPLANITLPPAIPGDRENILPAALAHNNRVPHYGLSEEICQQALQAYLASVSFVDAQVGRLLQGLDSLGLRENTIVVVWSDHGYHLGEHGGIWQKRTLFEESTRAPLLIHAPDALLAKIANNQPYRDEADREPPQPADQPHRFGNGQTCLRIVEFIDILPTVVELAGLEIPATASGRSLIPLLLNPQREWEHAAFTQILRPGVSDLEPDRRVMGRTVRTERWRYTEWNAGAEGAELYDHLRDPWETRNLASQPEWSPLIRHLRQQFNNKAEGLPPETPYNPERL